MPRSERGFLRAVAAITGRGLAGTERRFWLIVGLITLGGAVLRLLIYDHGLPYLEHTDELWLWLEGQRERRMPWPNASPFELYPPLITRLHLLAQLFAEAQGRTLAGDAVLDLRRLMLVFNVAGTGFVALLARRVAGPFAGVAAATLWAFHDVMLDIPLYAIGDALAYPLFILSLLLAVLALDAARHWRLALASFGIAALAFLLEYRLVIAFIPGLAVLALRAWRHYRPGRRQMLLWLVGGGAIAIVSGVVAFQLLPAKIQNIILGTLNSHWWDLGTVSLNLREVVRTLEPARSHKTTLASLAMITVCLALLYGLLARRFPDALVLPRRLWSRFRPGRREALLRVAAIGAIAIFAGAVIFTVLPAGLQPGIRESLDTHLGGLHSASAGLRQAVRDLGDIALAGFAAFLLLVLLPAPLRWWYRRAWGANPPGIEALALTVATLLLFLQVTSNIRPYGYEHYGVPLRHLIPAITLVYVLLGAALAQVMAVLRKRHWQALATMMLAIYALAVVVNPSLARMQRLRPEPWPTIVLPWINDSLEPAKILLYSDSVDWFSRAKRVKGEIVVFDALWGGIPYRQGFDWQLTDDVSQRPLQEWVDSHDITWLALPLGEQQRLQQDAAGRDFLAQLLPVREFRGPPEREGAEVAFYRLWRMQHESDIRFGEHIRLVGHDLHTPDPRPGDDLAFTLYWNAAATPGENYSFFLHLVSAADDARPLARAEGRPAMPERPTRTWDQPGETLISPRFALTLPPDLAPGDYRVLPGLHDVETGARLPVRDARGASTGDARELLRLNISDDGTVTVRETSLATK